MKNVFVEKKIWKLLLKMSFDSSVTSSTLKIDISIPQRLYVIVKRVELHTEIRDLIMFGMNVILRLSSNWCFKNLIDEAINQYWFMQRLDWNCKKLKRRKRNYRECKNRLFSWMDMKNSVLLFSMCHKSILNWKEKSHRPTSLQ